MWFDSSFASGDREVEFVVDLQICGYLVPWNLEILRLKHLPIAKFVGKAIRKSLFEFFKAFWENLLAADKRIKFYFAK